jgi:hypothetical protein
LDFFTLPRNLNTLKKFYPGWGALMEKLIDRKFTSKDIKRFLDLSYRQLTDWEGRGKLKSIFIKSVRERTEGWRRFSILDLFSLGLLKELKKEGIPITRLQKFMGMIFFVDDVIYNNIPSIVCGEDVYIYTDLNNLMGTFCLAAEDQENIPPFIKEELRKSGFMVLLLLNKIIEDIFQKMELPDFKAIKKPDGGYKFHINGVPLALENLSDEPEKRENQPFPFKESSSMESENNSDRLKE